MEHSLTAFGKTIELKEKQVMAIMFALDFATIKLLPETAEILGPNIVTRIEFGAAIAARDILDMGMVAKSEFSQAINASREAQFDSLSEKAKNTIRMAGALMGFKTP